MGNFSLSDMIPFKRYRGYNIPSNIADPNQPDDGSLPQMSPIEAIRQKLADITDSPEALEQYKHHLGNLPSRQPLSTGSRVLAALAGGLVGASKGDAGEGIKYAQEAIQAPYKRSLEDWQTKGKALGEQAGIEKEQLGNQRANLTAQSNILHQGVEEKNQANQFAELQKEHGLGHEQWNQQFGEEKNVHAQTAKHQSAEEALKREEINQTGGLRRDLQQMHMDQFLDNQAKWHESQYAREIKPFQGEDLAYGNIASAVKSGNPIDRISALHSYIRDITQSAKAAGASGVQQYLKALGASDRFGNFVANWTENQPIDDKTLHDIYESATRIHEATNAKRSQVQRLHANWAKAHNRDPKEIMPDYSDNADTNNNDSSEIDRHLAEIHAGRQNGNSR